MWIFEPQVVGAYQSVVQLSIAVNSALVAIFLVFQSERTGLDRRISEIETFHDQANKSLGGDYPEIVALSGWIAQVRAELPLTDSEWVSNLKRFAVWVALLSVPILLAATVLADAMIPRAIGLFGSIVLVAPIAVALVLALRNAWSAKFVSSEMMAQGFEHKARVARVLPTPRS